MKNTFLKKFKENIEKYLTKPNFSNDNIKVKEKISTLPIEIENIIKETDIILNTGGKWCNDDWEKVGINWAIEAINNYIPKRKEELINFWNGYENAILFLTEKLGKPIYSGRGTEYKKEWEELKIKPNVPISTIYNTIKITWWEYENRTIFVSISCHDAHTLLGKHLEVFPE